MKITPDFKFFVIGTRKYFDTFGLVVIRSTDKKQIDDCCKEIISFLKKKKIQIIEK